MFAVHFFDAWTRDRARDLFAGSLDPAGLPSSRRSFPDDRDGRSKWAAAALKAKLYLFDREWADAREWCVKIIDDSPHRLLENYADVFEKRDLANQYNDEHIYSVGFTGRWVN